MGEYKIEEIKQVSFIFTDGLPLWDSNLTSFLLTEDITVKRLGQALLYCLQAMPPRKDPSKLKITEIIAGKLYNLSYSVVDKLCGEQIEYSSSYAIKVSPFLLSHFVNTTTLKIAHATSLTSEMIGARTFAKALNND